MRSQPIFIATALIALCTPLAAQTAEPATPVEQMRAAAAAGDIRTARSAAMKIARDGNDNAAAAEALWLVAQLDNAEGRQLRAAAALDGVARHAATYGDPVLQARALLESTALYAGEHRFDAAAERLAQLRPLLQSPVLSEDFRAEASARLHL